MAYSWGCGDGNTGGTRKDATHTTHFFFFSPPVEPCRVVPLRVYAAIHISSPRRKDKRPGLLCLLKLVLTHHTPVQAVSIAINLALTVLPDIGDLQAIFVGCQAINAMNTFCVPSHVAQLHSDGGISSSSIDSAGSANACPIESGPQHCRQCQAVQMLETTRLLSKRIRALEITDSRHDVRSGTVLDLEDRYYIVYYRVYRGNVGSRQWWK